MLDRPALDKEQLTLIASAESGSEHKGKVAPRRRRIVEGKAKGVAPKKVQKLSRKPSKRSRTGPTTLRADSKGAGVLQMISRSKGATLAEIIKATGWQPHSVRGFISGTLGKKMDLNVLSTKGASGQRTYSLQA